MGYATRPAAQPYRTIVNEYYGASVGVAVIEDSDVDVRHD